MSNCVPDTLYAKIRVKRSLVPNERPSKLDLGELAVNVHDGLLFVGNQFGNPVLISGTGTGGGGIYSAGSGIIITGSNQISFDPTTVPNESIPIIKIEPPQEGSGFLFYNGTDWVFDTPATGINLNALFACIGGNINGQYYIDGGNASTATYCSQ